MTRNWCETTTTKGLTGHLADREVGRRECDPVAHDPWQEAVAAARGVSEEVSLAVATDDLQGVCLRHTPVFLEVDRSGTTMNWRGRTVEYSGDRAASAGRGFLCRQCSTAETAARLVSAHSLSVETVLLWFIGLGLAVNNPIFALGRESSTRGCDGPTALDRNRSLEPSVARLWSTGSQSWSPMK